MTPAQPRPSREFELRLEIRTTPEAAWAAISRGEELRRWFAPSAHVEPGVGGKIVWHWNERFTWPQTIEIWKPDERLRTRYESTVPDGKGGRHPLFVDFLLQGAEGKTTLRLVHSGFGPEVAFAREYDGISQGWPGELRSLRTYLEHHAGRDRQLAWVCAPVDLSPEEAWTRLTGPEAFACGPQVQWLREGAPIHMTTATGDVFQGEVSSSGRREVYVLLGHRLHSLLRVSIEDAEAGSLVWLWYESWREQRAQVDALQGRWEELVKHVFPLSGAFEHGPRA